MTLGTDYLVAAVAAQVLEGKGALAICDDVFMATMTTPSYPVSKHDIAS